MSRLKRLDGPTEMGWFLQLFLSPSPAPPPPLTRDIEKRSSFYGSDSEEAFISSTDRACNDRRIPFHDE